MIQPARYAMHSKVRFIVHRVSLETFVLVVVREGPVADWLDSNLVKRAAEVKSLLCS